MSDNPRGTADFTRSSTDQAAFTEDSALNHLVTVQLQDVANS